jgi:hypothetical protein
MSLTSNSYLLKTNNSLFISFSIGSFVLAIAQKYLGQHNLTLPNDANVHGIWPT